MLRIRVEATVLQACLPHAYPSGQRKHLPVRHLQNLSVIHKPVGIFMCNWASQRLASEVARILIEEQLGFLTTVYNGATSSDAMLYATAGCLEPDNFQVDPKCGSNLDPTVHLGMEVWGDHKGTGAKLAMNSWPHIHPIDVGDIGYEGTDGLYVKVPQQQSAYDAEGLDLSNFRGYNVSWHEPWKYFDEYTDLDRSKLVRCHETLMSYSPQVKEFLSLTNDYDGVVKKANTVDDYVARCWWDFWWFSPACRENKSTCIPAVTMGNGWWSADAIQKFAYFNMPIAWVTLSSTANWNVIANSQRVLLYAFRPGAVLASIGPTPVRFPLYNKQQVDNGIRLSMSSTTRLSKWVWNGLRQSAYDVYTLAQRLQFSLQGMESLIKHTVNQSTSYYTTIACDWVLQNSNIWSAWLLDPRDCFVGYGLINASGHFVASIFANATACARCEPGKMSSRKICIECPAGKMANAFASVKCLDCARGTFIGYNGSSACFNCNQSYYANLLGSTSCESCPSGGFQTRLMKSTSAFQCICPSQTFYVAAGGNTSQVGFCQSCNGVMGLHCPGDSITRGDSQPNLLEGFMVYPVLDYQAATPSWISQRVYECHMKKRCKSTDQLWDERAMCGSRTGIACATCPRNYYSAGDMCKTCKASAVRIVVGFFAIGPFLSLFLYFKMNSENVSDDDIEELEEEGAAVPSRRNGMATVAVADMEVEKHKLLERKAAGEGAQEPEPHVPTKRDRVWLWLIKFRNEVFRVSRDTFAQLLSFVQMLGLLRQLYPGGPRVVRAMMDLGAVATVDIKVFTSFIDKHFSFQVGCVTGPSFKAQHAVSLCLPCVVLSFFVFNYIVSVYGVKACCPKCRKHLRRKPKAGAIGFVKHHLAEIRITGDKTLNCIGIQLTGLFIGLTSNALAVFVTYRHPNNNAQSVVRYPNVLQGSDDWWEAVPMAIVGILFYCVTVLAVCCWVAWRAPRFAHLSSFRVRYYFILDGFRPEIWWWGVFLLFRGLCLNLVLVMFPNRKQFACMLLAVLFTCFLCMKFYFSPWPKTSMNISDTSSAFAMCVLIPAFAIRSTDRLAFETTGAYSDPVQLVEACAVVLPFVTTAFSLCIPMAEFSKRQNIIVQTMVSARRLRYVMMLISRCTTRELTNMFLNFNDHEHQVISDFMRLFCAELLHMQNSSSIIQQRLIPDAEKMEIVDMAKLMHLVEGAVVKECKDDVDIMHEIGLVEFVLEQMLAGYKDRFGNDLRTTSLKAALSEKIHLPVVSFHSSTTNSSLSRSARKRVRIRDVFAAMDPNLDGVLTKDEFVDECIKLAPMVLREEAACVFDAIDWDKSGSITMEEFDMGCRGIALGPQNPTPIEALERGSIMRVAMQWPMRKDECAHQTMQQRLGRRMRCMLAAKKIQRRVRRYRERFKSQAGECNETLGGIDVATEVYLTVADNLFQDRPDANDINKLIAGSAGTPSSSSTGDDFTRI